MTASVFCPNCGHAMVLHGQMYICPHCGSSFPASIDHVRRCILCGSPMRRRVIEQGSVVRVVYVCEHCNIVEEATTIDGALTPEEVRPVDVRKKDKEEKSRATNRPEASVTPGAVVYLLESVEREGLQRWSECRHTVRARSGYGGVCRDGYIEMCGGVKIDLHDNRAQICYGGECYRDEVPEELAEMLDKCKEFKDFASMYRLIFTRTIPREVKGTSQIASEIEEACGIKVLDPCTTPLPERCRRKFENVLRQICVQKYKWDRLVEELRALGLNIAEGDDPCIYVQSLTAAERERLEHLISAVCRCRTPLECAVHYIVLGREPPNEFADEVHRLIDSLYSSS